MSTTLNLEFVKGNPLANVVCKSPSVCSGLDVLTHPHLPGQHGRHLRKHFQMQFRE